MLSPLLEAIGEDVLQDEEDKNIEDSIDREKTRDIFLDSHEDAVAGAEEDKEVNDIVDKIPVSGDDKEVEAAIENYIGVFPS